MIEKKDIFNMARHIFRHNQGISDPKIMHPGREWAIGLVGATAGIIIGAVASINTFVSFNQEQIDQLDVTEVAIPYKASLVEAAISKYQAKSAGYQEIYRQLSIIQFSTTISTTSSIKSIINTNIDAEVNPISN